MRKLEMNQHVTDEINNYIDLSRFSTVLHLSSKYCSLCGLIEMHTCELVSIQLTITPLYQEITHENIVNLMFLIS